MNDSEQTKHIEDLQKKNKELREEKECHHRRDQ